MKKFHKSTTLVMFFALLVAVTVPINCSNKANGDAVTKTVNSDVASAKQADAPATEASATEGDDVVAMATAGEGKENTASKPENTAQTPKVLKLHGLPPNLDLVDEMGNTLTNVDFKGKTYIIAFWSDQCDLCLTEMKAISDEIAAKKYDIPLIAVSPGQDGPSKKKEATILRDKGINAIATFDRQFMTTMGYQLNGVPYFGLVDKKNRLQAAGRLLTHGKMKTLTFLDMINMVAKGEDVPVCEYAPYEPAEQYKELIGKEATVLTGETLDGKTDSTLYYKGFSKVLAVFWSPTCPHCRAELPRLEAFYKEKADSLNIKVIGFAAMPEDRDMEFYEGTKDLVTKLGVTFPNIPDYGTKFQEMYGVKGVPSMFFIDEKGIIENAISGELLFTSESLECIINNLKDSGK